MFCSNCGTPRTQELSYCNRCGADLRERREPDNTAAIRAVLTAITTLGLVGLAIMLMGAVVLRKKSKPRSGADRCVHVVYVSDRVCYGVHARKKPLEAHFVA